MPKRLSEFQKKDIVQAFVNGLDIKEIAMSYNFSTQTIIKQIKNIIGNEEFKNVKASNSKEKKRNKSSDLKRNEVGEGFNLNGLKAANIKQGQDTYKETSNSGDFFEVIPLTEDVELNNQKDMASIPISDIELPEVVYILVDKKTELEPKMLKEFPDWSFLPQEDLERMTLIIYSDKKKARQLCSKDQKLIKIPNSQVLLITSKHLEARGISRIIFKDLLISI